MIRKRPLVPRLAAAATLALAFALPAAAQPAPPQRRDIVGAYYYPWYFPGKWAAHASQLTPTLGWYKTDSLPIVVQHIDSAAYYGVDVLFMSWWKPSDVTDQHLRNGFLKAPNNGKIKFAMLMEPLGELDSLDGKRDAVVDFAFPATLKGWIEQFQYFKDNFFAHPSYFRIGGRPVVLIYVTRTFKNFGPAHIDSLKKHVGDVYIMADEAFLFQQQDPETARNGIRNRQTVFESYVSYNSYEAAKIVPGDSALSYQRRVAMPYYTAWAQKTLFHPPIMPYYKDFRDGHPPLPGTTGAFKTIIDEIKALPLIHPTSEDVTRIYMVTSWNEWFEGTSIESSVENGFRFAQVLRDAFVANGTRSRPEKVQVAKETPARLKSVLRNAYACLEPAGERHLTARPGCDQGLVMVDLGGDEVAFRDPRSGKYLGHHTDQRVFAVEAAIGTWEIWKKVPQGANFGFRSKKTGTWLRAMPYADPTLLADGPANNADAAFKIEEGPVGLSPRPGRAWDFAATLRSAGGELIFSTPRADPVRITITDVGGQVLAERKHQGGGTLSLGRFPGGIKAVRVEAAAGARIFLAPGL